MDDLPALLRLLGGTWQYLTEHWFSLRSLDNANVSRRTVHPWWAAVQDCATTFGDVETVTRTKPETVADTSWYVAHIAGCLPGFAARREKPTLAATLDDLFELLLRYWNARDFEQQYRVKSILLGRDPDKRTSGADLPPTGV